MHTAEEIHSEAPARKFDVVALLKTPTFQLVLLVLAATVFCFWPLFGTEIWHRWSDMEGYYAHGFLIPLCSAYLVWDKWDKIKDIKVQPQWWAVALLLPILFVTLAASRAIMPTFLSGLFVMTLLVSALFIGGPRWLLALTPAILFLLLGMPIFDKMIDTATMPLQIKSTSVAYYLLQFTGFQPLRTDPTVLYVPNFSMPLTVAAACSGLKTTIAVSAAAIFFILLLEKKWWMKAFVILPIGIVVAVFLSMFINGLRIGLIGVAADMMPEWSGNNFKMMHDISGYVALIVCFFILGWISRKVGYK
ncbi:MAG: exosortase/archaeosortase family protein [Armatimonadetes bacterium]|nr:exosortase/archaeosortase family protein [Armatimonadota bacterium]